MSVFAWPGGWPLLVLAPAVWLALRWVDRRRALGLDARLGARAPQLAVELDPRRRALRRVLFTLALLLSLLAVMQPHWGEDRRRVDQRGVDLLVCLDVSRSMLARDLPPNRLAHAKAEIAALANRTRGDRLGLVAFAGGARLLVPLTRDTGSFLHLLDLADPFVVTRGGTDLGAALEASLGALSGATGEHEVVLLITDGEDLEDRGLRAAAACAERGVTVHCVGIGSTRGSKIAVAVPGEAGERFLRDASGEEVVTVMDPAALRAIAETTGGRYVEAATTLRPLIELYEAEIVPMAAKSFGSGGRDGRANRFQLPLAAAFVLLVIELAMTDRRRR